MDEPDAASRPGRDPGDSGDTSERRGVYTQGRKISRADMRIPIELTRSRRVGLIATVCTDCGAAKDQGYCRHTLDCSTPGTWDRKRTGPLADNETAADAGW